MSQRPCIQSLEPRLLLTAVDPYNMGKGDWIWTLSNARANTGTSTNLALFQYMKSKGMKWAIVKAADGTSSTYGSTQFTAQLVADAHTAGLKLFAYQYVRGADPAGEAAAAKAVIARANPDGLAIDAEGEYEALANNAAAATTYCTTIKAAYPSLFMVHAPFPIVSYHSAFPYYTFGKYCDAVMPQDYWGAIKVTPTRMVQWQNDEWNTLYNSWKGTSKADGIKPIVPIGQGWNDTSTNFTSGADIQTFVTQLKTIANPAGPGGYKGVSYWSVQHHTADMWTGIGAANIGDPVFTVGQTVQVSGTGTTGLKAWSDSTSIAPATFTTQPEGAVGTIVSGPVFAQNYNRWQIRYKGETVDRWSAEDYLVAAAAPSAPVYVSPGNGVTVATPPAKLDWNDVGVAISYDVYLDGVLKTNTTASEYAISSLIVGSHNWQVKAKNSAGTVAGATWSFTYMPVPVAPSVPTPGNAAVLYVPPAALDWADATYATSYDVYLDGALLGNVAASKWTLTNAPAVMTPHTWRVVARNVSGSTSGANWTFEVDPIAGDANADGVVNTGDFKIVMSHNGQAGGWGAGDFSGDGLVDFTDFQVWELNFGKTAPVAADPISADAVLADATAITPVAVKRPPFSLTPIRRPAPQAPVRRRG
ncbi:MAG: Peptidoglycan-binding domain 1 protein [Phycisphaerales bacterium]|nr:Peptidoglycan-binding domain 1 protein [Phycisphaerales bacterium]